MNQFEHLKIPLEAIQSATNNFSADSSIGRGGFGNVYKGELVHSKGKTMVALKRLNRDFGQGNTEFWKEIMLLSFYRHPNIVSLLGYCDDHGEKILMYEYVSRKSLDKHLTSEDLTWVQRLKICIGAAHGLAYIHTPADTQLRIVHRDVKSSNILLDSNWNAKISDFGLSKFTPANNQFSCVITNPAGTPGYIDPVYHETWVLTKESDVYSFGVVLFEVLCGRIVTGNKDRQPLVGLVREYYKQNKISELAYSKIKDEIKDTSLKLFADIAYKCLETKREERPLMTQIVSTLERALEIQESIAGILKVNIAYIRQLNSKDSTNDIWDFGELKVDGSYHYLVFYIDGGNSPLQHKKTKFEQVFTLYVNNFKEQELVILLNYAESVKNHRHIKKARLKLADLTPGILEPCFLNVQDNNIRHIDNLAVDVLYEPTNINITNVYSSVQKAPIGTPKHGGLLVVIIHSAILDDERSRAHSSVSLLFRGDSRETQSMMYTNKPIWLKELSYLLKQPPTKNENLHLEVINNSRKGQFLGKGSFGWVDISLASLICMKWTNESYQLKQGNKLSNNFIRVELQWRTSE